MSNVITYQLAAFVDGNLVYKQIFGETGDLIVEGIEEAEKMVENNIQLDDVTLNDIVKEMV